MKKILFSVVVTIVVILGFTSCGSYELVTAEPVYPYYHAYPYVRTYYYPYYRPYYYPYYRPTPPPPPKRPRHRR